MDSNNRNEQKSHNAGHILLALDGRRQASCPVPLPVYSLRNEYLSWSIMFTGYRRAVTFLVPSYPGPTHPQSGDQGSPTLEKGVGRNLELPLPTCEGPDRSGAGRGPGMPPLVRPRPPGEVLEVPK